MRTPGEDRALAAGSCSRKASCERRRSRRGRALPPSRSSRGHNVVDVYLLGEARGVARHDPRPSGATPDQLVVRAVRPRDDRLAQDARVGAAGDVDDDDGRSPRDCRTGFASASACSTAPAGFTRPGSSRQTGCCEVSAEDVGRHNAVDKVIGAMLLDDRLPLAVARAGRERTHVVRDRAEGLARRHRPRLRGLRAVEPGDRACGRGRYHAARVRPRRRVQHLHSPGPTAGSVKRATQTHVSLRLSGGRHRVRSLLAWHSRC